MNKVIELAHNWRTTGAAKGELRQFTPSAKLKGVYELAQTILPKPNWRANWRGSGAQDFGPPGLALSPRARVHLRSPHSATSPPQNATARCTGFPGLRTQGSRVLRQPYAGRELRQRDASLAMGNFRGFQFPLIAGRPVEASRSRAAA
jgi:hypothetical protein